MQHLVQGFTWIDLTFCDLVDPFWPQNVKNRCFMVIFSLESILKSSYWINGMRLKQNEEFHHVNSREISDYSKYEKIESSQNKVECAVFNSKTGKTRINNSFHPFFFLKIRSFWGHFWRKICAKSLRPRSFRLLGNILDHKILIDQWSLYFWTFYIRGIIKTNNIQRIKEMD